MPHKKENVNIDQYVEMVLKGRWYIIIPFCMAMLVGIYLAITLPRVYEAGTLILVEPQRVPSNYVQSVVSIDLDARISTISQQIMSRSNLEKIINEFKLFSEPEYAKMYMEEKIENLRKRIEVKVIGARRGVTADAFSILFKGSQPERVMKVANALSTYVINENLKVREAQAVGTSNFLDSELSTMRKRLEDVEETLKEYRKQYMGELPEQLETNLNILDRLQVQIGEREESLRNAKDRMAMIENQIQAASEMNTTQAFEQTESDYAVNLRQLREQLASLKNRYTNRHPDVIRLENRIADFESKNKETAPIDGQVQEGTDEIRAAGINQRQLYEIKQDVNNLTDEIAQLGYEVRRYQKRVENTPKREQELMSLRRDYNNIQESYSSLLSRKLEAEISVNMERKQKGEQFRIIDSARLPQKPVSPDMRKLFLLTVALGLGIGGGVVSLLDFINTAFKKPEDVEFILGLPILATIPIILQRKDKVWRRFNTVMSICGAIVSLALMAGFGVLTFKGVDVTIAFVRRFVNI
jgi:polysaccharide chain length determinant protein (PEP-CTERM system associated)